VRYNQIIASQGQRFGHNEEIVGVQLHGFAFNETKDGATLYGVTFAGFPNAKSSRVALVDIDNKKMSGHFDYWYAGLLVVLGR
jgi:hypothetical protein